MVNRTQEIEPQTNYLGNQQHFGRVAPVEDDETGMEAKGVDGQHKAVDSMFGLAKGDDDPNDCEDQNGDEKEFGVG